MRARSRARRGSARRRCAGRVFVLGAVRKTSRSGAREAQRCATTGWRGARSEASVSDRLRFSDRLRLAGVSISPPRTTHSFASELLASAATSVARVVASSAVSLHGCELFLSQRELPTHGETS